MYVVIGLLFIAAICFIMAKKKKKEQKEVVAQPLPEPIGRNPNVENIKVAGVSFRQDEIKSLGERNEDYDLSKAQIKEDLPDESIYEWEFPEYPAKFEFEPDNEADPNAIAIYVEGVKIGYVKKGSTSHIRNLINSGVIEKATCKIYGGSFKRYDSDMEEFENEKADVDAKVTVIKKS